MDMQKVKAAAQAIAGSIKKDFATFANRDRRYLEAIAAELGMDKDDASLAHISHMLMDNGISMAEEFPKAKYRKTSSGHEMRVVDNATDEAALPADGAPWMDTPPMPAADADDKATAA